MIFEIFFWSSIILIFYAYLGYPLLLIILSFFRNRPIRKGNITPFVTFIITAHNEEKRIHGKVKNTLNQDYPKEKLEIIVASDCSTDKTEEIVRSFKSFGVILVRSLERKGKEFAQKLAVDSASGEVLVFSDTATTLPINGIRNIVKNFFDPTVGCVSSVDKFIDTDGQISGEGIYVRYEMFLRDLETNVNTLVGLSGSFFAVRKEVCYPWGRNLQSDFNTLLNSVELGLRGVSDADSIGYYKNIANERKEFERKVRTVLRGISVLMKSLPMLNPLKYGFFSWQLFSHKLCRWLVPFFMITAFLSNTFMFSRSVFYLYTFMLQCIFYTMALAGIWRGLSLDKSVFKIPSFFVMVNLSILNAWYRYLRGERVTFWNPSQR